MLRIPVCQTRVGEQNLDAARHKTVCEGCQFDINDGCPNTRVWKMTRAGKPVSNCKPEDLVYCRHYDCGCDECVKFHAKS
ncbi:MAG: hypothetical protein ABJA67_03115 [Chthonomonadales bacterium]